MNHLLLFEDFELNESSRIDFLTQQYADHLDLLNKVMETDPTDKKLYSQWLMNLSLGTKKMSMMGIEPLKAEDLYKATDYLVLFDRPTVRRQLAKKDINQYQSLQELGAAVFKFKDDSSVLSNKERKSTNLVASVDGFDIFVPKTYEDSCTLGSGTEWCTATGKTREHYDLYSKQGKIFILIPKDNPSEKLQFHFEAGQYMDKLDNGIDVEAFRVQHPAVIAKLRELYGNDDLFGIYSGLLGHSREELKAASYSYTGNLVIWHGHYAFPGNLRIEGDLTFRGSTEVNLTDNLTVTGYLTFKNVKGLDFNKGSKTTVGKDMEHSGANITGSKGVVIIGGDFQSTDSYFVDVHMEYLTHWRVKGEGVWMGRR